MAENAAPRRSRFRRALRLCRVLTAGGVVVCERCEIADRYFARMRGLLGRKGLEPGGGMLLTPESSVHMFFMHFPIDVVFLDREHKVVGVRHELGPWQVAGARGAYAALELPAGAAAAAGIGEGDALVFEDLEG
jgi:uncharacterized membrane protein (UPF0127 family)